MSMLRRPVARWLPVVAWAALIFALSSRSTLPSVAGGRGLPLSQAGHVVEYAVLALLLFRALSQRLRNVSLSRGALLCLALSLLYAVSDELHQAFVPQRQPSLGDVALDGLGAAVALLAATWLRRLKAPG